MVELELLQRRERAVALLGQLETPQLELVRLGEAVVGRVRLALAEERDRALAALKELEFDHRTGKISDDDYRELIGPLRLRVAEALRALEPQAESTEERVRATS